MVDAGWGSPELNVRLVTGERTLREHFESDLRCGREGDLKRILNAEVDDVVENQRSDFRSFNSGSVAARCEPNLRLTLDNIGGSLLAEVLLDHVEDRSIHWPLAARDREFEPLRSTRGRCLWRCRPPQGVEELFRIVDVSRRCRHEQQVRQILI